MTDSIRSNYIEILYDIWIKEFTVKLYYSKIKFFGIKEIETKNSFIQENYIKSQIFASDKSRDFLSSKLLISMKDFLNNSNADWFLRICDDTFINLRAFNHFYSELNIYTNPLTDKLIQGNCIKKEINNIYLQGGSGIIFSRFSVIEFVSNFSFFKILTKNIHNDDTAIGAWLIHRKYNSKSITNRFFIGHLFQGLISFLNISKIKIKDCDVKVLKTYSSNCRAFLTNLKEIVFWHDRVNFMKFIPFAKKFIFNLPNDLFFYQFGRFPIACRGYNITGKYYE